MNNKIRLLLVEDNPADIDLTIEAFDEAEIEVEIEVVENGEQALNYLYNKGTYTEKPKPNIILLDLNMPKMNGKEVLERVKVDENLREIPVIVLTTSEAEGDVLASYDLRANSYIVKPVDLDGFLEMVKALVRFWMTTIKLP